MSSEDILSEYKTRLIEEIDYLLILAQKSNASLVPGLIKAIEVIEETD